MITHDELLSLARAAYRTEPDVLRRLEAPPPPPGDTSPAAMRWYADWTVVLLAALPPTGERLTWEAAAQIIRLPDPNLMGQVLDRVRQTDALRLADDVEPIILTEADFARFFKAH